MSVVNKMLNDLEQRENQSVGTHANYQPSHQRSKKTIALVLIALLLCVLIGLAWMVFFSSKSSTSPTTQPKKDLVNLSVDGSKSKVDESANVKINDIASAILNGSDEEVSVRKSSSSSISSRENSSDRRVSNKHLSDNRTIETEALSQEEAVSSITPSLESKQASTSNSLAKTETVSAPETTARKIDDDDAEKDAKQEPGLQAFTSALVIAPSDGKRQPDYQMLVADALANNNTSQAIETLKSWIAAAPNQLESRKKLAALYFASGDAFSAESVLNDALVLYPNSESLRLMSARLYVQMSNIDKAFEALSFESDNSDFLHYRASLARQQNRLSLALQDYSTLTAFNPLDEKAWLGLAVVGEQLGDKLLAYNSFKYLQTLTNLEPRIQQYAAARINALGDVKANESK